MAIRSAQILISYHALACLRECARIDGAGYPENVLELILSEYLDKRPEIADLVKMQDAAKKQAREEWEKKWKRDDAIPMNHEP